MGAAIRQAVGKEIMRSGNKGLCHLAKPFKIQACGLIIYRRADYVQAYGLTKTPYYDTIKKKNLGEVAKKAKISRIFHVFLS